MDRTESEREISLWNYRKAARHLWRGREEKEIKVYDLLDRLGIEYFRTDHKAAGTIADCLEVDRVLGITICKNLFLCNRQKTAFYLLMMPGHKKLAH